MLNFRKLKQGFSPSLISDGKQLYDEGCVLSAKILELNANHIRLGGSIKGSFNNSYDCHLEVDRYESEAIDSDCDCPYNYDCQHLAALIFYLENNMNQLLVAYSKESNLSEVSTVDEETKKGLAEAFKTAENKEAIRQEVQFKKELLSEYIDAAQSLARSPFFLSKEGHVPDKAELAVIFTQQSNKIYDHSNAPEVQLALRLPFRSKPLHIPNLHEFLDAFRYEETLYLGGKRCFFNRESFDDLGNDILKIIVDHARFAEGLREKNPRVAQMSGEAFGVLLAHTHAKSCERVPAGIRGIEVDEQESVGVMPYLYVGCLEQSLQYSLSPASLSFELEYIKTPFAKILLKPSVSIQDKIVELEEILFYHCAAPGLIYNNVYYRFPQSIKRTHLQHLSHLREITIPEPLFGTFVENALPELSRFGEVKNREIVEKFVTLPYVGPVMARCDISYLDGELDAALFFIYENVEIPVADDQLTSELIFSFITPQGVVARNLSEERKIVNDLFQGFVFNKEQGVFSARVSKKIVEFMTETIPQYQHQVTFNCPENLREQFIYDESAFTLNFRECASMGFYELDLEVEGHLKGAHVDQLWECISSRKTYLELETFKTQARGKNASAVPAKLPKILVLNLDRITPLIQLFDELGVTVLENQTKKLPLWSLATLRTLSFEDLPASAKMTEKLQEIQQQMLGEISVEASPIPKEIQATVRNYQKEGAYWLERLRSMHLSGILADDMGLGKTLQALIAITQHHLANKGAHSLIVCPTSLTYNWKEECHKFNPALKVLLIDGTPTQRKKLLKEIPESDVTITSYTLLQKDIETYKKENFSYCVLDEAQHIKNRTTRNAKSVKMVNAAHRLILTGTPIENSLDELWSLFDFLMPGLLSSYERFIEKYVRNAPYTDSLSHLRKKVTPFILRRMKKDVLQDLPPVSNIVYHCTLSPVQEELYRSYASSAKEELLKLVKKEGFDRVRIHVLATLTRLKQICCHPAIFAKEKVEEGDSAKYDMLMELLQTLVEGGHKTVIFSQYTRMLNIMREDLDNKGFNYSYLDGSSKNRLDIVNKFNEDASIPIFLVSLKAGGSGLNIVSADTVIHYDMWWNPAVENQATDRVHRIGQTRSVSSYKLITLGTIEEKILQLQERKKDLMKKIISGDDEIISKLTWEEVLELLEV